MKILFLSGADQYGGTYQMAKNILQYVPLYDSRIEYIVLTQKHGPLNQWCTQQGIKNYCLPYRYCTYFPSHNRFLSFVKHIVKMCLVSVSNFVALKKIKQLGILGSIDLIHTNIQRDLFGMIISDKYNIPNITHMRELSSAHFHLRPLYKNQFSYMNKFTSRFVAVSDAVKEEWENFGIEKEKIHVIHDGVDPKSLQYRKCGENRGDILKIIMSGAIYEGKGQFELIKAVSQVLSCHEINLVVDFYGYVPPNGKKYYDDLISYIKENKLKNFRFKGHFENHELKEILSEYDVGIVCSKAEGFGLATIEYMMSGLCVIASNTGANMELIDDKKTGFLYSLGNIKQLASTILYVYQNPKKCQEVAHNASTYARTQYTIERSVLNLIKAYYEVCGGKSGEDPV